MGLISTKFRRKSRTEQEAAARQQKLMRAIGNLDPLAEADAEAVEKRLRNMSYGSNRRAAS